MSLNTKVSALPKTNSVSNNALFLVVRDPAGSPTSNGVSLATIREAMVIKTTPANSSALTVTNGILLYDSNYLYVAVANNVVKRVALSSF